MEIIKQGLSEREKIGIAKCYINDTLKEEINCNCCEASFKADIADYKLKLRIKTIYTFGGGIRVPCIIYKLRCPCCNSKIKGSFIISDWRTYKSALKEIRDECVCLDGSVCSEMK